MKGMKDNETMGYDYGLFYPDVKELECELEDYKVLPDDYEFADGYYDESDEEE